MLEKTSRQTLFDMDLNDVIILNSVDKMSFF